ncbi:hypothetical protein [Flavobacterium sp.]|uniref:hypothetical protein n=1 Tax=Flavobacterium sp. TaxID=239 RepID=UPI00333EC0D8
MKKLSQKMSLENRIILLNSDSLISEYLMESLDNKISWTELTLKDCFYLSQLFDLELNIEKINTFFSN